MRLVRLNTETFFIQLVNNLHVHVLHIRHGQSSIPTKGYLAVIVYKALPSEMRDQYSRFYMLTALINTASNFEYFVNREYITS